MRPRLAAVTAFAMLAIAMAFAGCGSDGDGDPALTIYLSAPLKGPGAADGRDVADGARMALDDAGDEAAGTSVRLVVLGDAADGGARSALAGANARTATEDSTAIAYVGELDSGSTRTSLPITNEAGLLQVSAGASATDLTRAAPGSDQVPDVVQPSGVRTFARVVPSDVAQGAAAAGAMRRAGDERVGVVRSPSADASYAHSLVLGLDSVTNGPERAGGPPLDALYQPSPLPGAHRALADRSGVSPGQFYGADATISGTPPTSTLPPGSLAVSGTLAPSQLADPDFADLFADAYERPPGRFAAYGYEAMASVLDAIDRADDPLDRKSVVDAYFATSDRDSVLGPWSVDDVGDTTLDRVGAYVVRPDGALRPADEPLRIP
ncbi:MAG: hypothetical protein U0R51_02905 [Solirubrobacterales bacterium]